QIPLVQRHVLDPNDPLIELELRDAIDEQKGISMRKNAFDSLVIERERQVHEPVRLYFGDYSMRRSPHAAVPPVIHRLDQSPRLPRRPRTFVSSSSHCSSLDVKSRRCSISTNCCTRFRSSSRG